MRRPSHVAVLGSGIMGTSTALYLARRGVRVTLFDAAAQPFAGASRWNEGKIHLGYLYSGNASLETARRVLPGGLAFKRLTEGLIGCSLDAAVTPHDDTYLVHRESVTTVEAMERYVAAVFALAAAHPDAGHYFVPLQKFRPRRLSPAELEARYLTTHLLGGFAVPERSVSTPWLADRFVEALRAERRIELALNARVTAVRSRGGAFEGPWCVHTSREVAGPFDAVVNALWEGRLAIDAGLDLPPPPAWSHRFRLSVFLRTSRPADVPSTVIATGPFGDLKNYDRRSFYLSWYPAGLQAEGTGVAPPPVPALDATAKARIVSEVLARLGAVVRGVEQLAADAEQTHLEGGWVYAAGQGSLADPSSTLHRRDRLGMLQRGSYISVDTGKYSVAPHLARQVADALCPEL